MLLMAAAQLAYADAESTDVLGFDTPTGNLSFRARWNPDAGLSLRIAQGDREAAILVRLERTRGTITPVPASAFPRALQAGSRFHLNALPTESIEDAEVVLKIRNEMWAIYLQGRPVAAFPSPFVPPGSLSMPADQFPTSGETDARYQKIEDFVFHDDFLVPEGDENQLDAWEIESGTWRLHTVLDHITVQDKLEGGTGLKAEHSPNFYSLHGSGTNAVITTGHTFYDAFTYEASMQIMPIEAGLVFLHRGSNDYFAFTAEPLRGGGESRLRLKKASPDDEGTPTVLAVADTDVGREQWVKLGVKTYFNRIECYLDNVKVFDIRHELPDGGLLGLYAHGDAGTRFDDVDAASNHGLDLGDIHELRYHTIAEEGRIFPRGPLSGLFIPRREWDALKVGSSSSEQWIVVGSPADAAHIFSAHFQPHQAESHIGLLAGYTAADKPYYRFTRRQEPDRVVYKLERVNHSEPEVITEFTQPGGQSRVRDMWRSLMIDAGNPREMRMYDNDTLVLIHHPTEEPRGASGIYVGPNSAAQVRDVRYDFHRDDLHHNQYEKNRIFADDKFMRHWSSPEGEWFTHTNKTMWHKGDFFGRFKLQMPLVDGSEIHLGVKEGETNGAIRIIADADAIRLAVRDPKDGGFRVVADTTTTNLVAPDGKVKLYSIHHEGYWTWISSGDNVLISHALPHVLEGRRVRIAGFTVQQLVHTLAERYQVKDYLFTESLHDWTVNGGRWEIVNRFQCDPRWSHMNGQSRDGVASLWSKYQFSGDFCVEMYAGTRHGWYARPGDLNLTVHSASGAPSQGYTVTCSGWDFDHSQLYTRLYRNGKTFTESDKYLVPRVREGSTRHGLTPLVADGRPVHGAWYYVKLRRVGERLEYYFDNELVFAVDDHEPLQSGSLGIWTYLNSMVIARVKIAAEDIRPATRSFRAVSLDEKAEAVAETLTRDDGGLVISGASADLMQPAYWTSTTDAGRALLDWHTTADGEPYFVLRNTLGGGSMAAVGQAPPVALKDLAGLEFDVKRTPGAQFNFHLDVGTLSPSNRFVVARRYFHHLSGSENPDKTFAAAGSSPVDPVSMSGDRWHQNEDWQRVKVWLPELELRQDERAGLVVQIAGFGNLQPSFVAQGLHGNGPSAAYAVKGLREVRYVPPAFEIAKSGTATAPFKTTPEAGGPSHEFKTLEKLNTWTVAQTYPALQHHRLEYASSNGLHRVPIAWIHLPESLAVSAAWSTNRTGTILIQHDGDYPDPRFIMGTLALAKVPVPLVRGPGFSRMATIPRGSPFTDAESPILEGTFKAGQRPYAIKLQWSERPLPERPELTELANESLLFINFEADTPPQGLAITPPRITLQHDDPLQGRALRVRNFGAAHRLAAGINRKINLARFPIFQFRYRAPRLGRVSLALGTYVVHLSEDKTGQVVGDSLTLDDQWHTWHGPVSRAALDPKFDHEHYLMPSVNFGSKHAVDQSGLYTRWEIDDLVFGPAVREAAQLAMTPNYSDPDGIASVSIAVLPGATPAADLDASAIAALPWRAIPNADQATPDLAGLEDGRHHILFRAADTKGTSSSVTDIPFLLDREPPRRNYRFDEASKAYSNDGQIAIHFFQGSGAPLDYSTVKARWNEDVLSFPLERSTFAHSPDKDTLGISWAYCFRQPLRASTDGVTNWMVLSDIRDGAGNPVEDLRVPFASDYSKDKMPPTLLSIAYPSNILWSAGYENTAILKSTFEPGIKGATVSLIRTNGPIPFARFSAAEAMTNAWVTQAFAKPNIWRAGEHPLIAMRLRRPSVAEDDETNIEMTFTMGKDLNYTVHLSGPTPRKGALALDHPVTWKAGQWQPVIVDLKKLLESQAEEDEFEELMNNIVAAKEKDEAEPIELLLKRPITSLSLHQASTNKISPLDIESFFVMREWKETDEVTLDAYDASGVAGVRWWVANETDSLSVAPAQAQVAPAKGSWISVEVRDKAGNASPPFRLPLPGGTVPGLRPDASETASIKAAPDKQGG
ncbi:MAG: hypothetical protein O2901_03245 [Verrucomicrobia bacterium]|nr:hypothetical protein [Verrucomicrobiota bacterium]